MSKLTFWDKETSFEVALQYSTRTELKNGNGTVYQWLIRNKLLDEACGHMVSKYTNWTKATALELAAKYDYLKEFREANGGCYAWLCTKGHIEEAKYHFKTKDLTKKFRGLRNKSGIYFLYQDDVVVYIGKSEKGLSNRLNRHTFDHEKVFNKVTAFIIDNIADIQLAELYLIHRHSPIFNKDSNSGISSTLIIDNIDSIIQEELHFKSTGESA